MFLDPASPFGIGGYSAASDMPELWKVTIVNSQCEPPGLLNAPGQTGLYWGGVGEPIQRLAVGFDQSLEQILVEAGMDVAEIPKLLGMARARSERQFVDPRMPIQDAIDLAEYLANMAKGYVRFLPGAEIVGGDVDFAVVTRHERFKWIKRKHFYPAHLNPKETDHDHG
jgi:hypothetical protein